MQASKTKTATSSKKLVTSGAGLAELSGKKSGIPNNLAKTTKIISAAKYVKKNQLITPVKPGPKYHLPTVQRGKDDRITTGNYTGLVVHGGGGGTVGFDSLNR